MKATLKEIFPILEDEGHPANAKSMIRFGIKADKAFGIKLPVLRNLAKEIGKNTPLADELWREGHHECKLLATMIADPGEFTLEEADRWIKDIYSWDVCDQLCSNLLVKTNYAWELPERWSPLEREFERRAGIVMIVELAVHQKDARDERLIPFIPLLKIYATDSRNFVKKAVNWAIRQLGKRSAFLHPQMVSLCEELLEMNSRPASWIARDALRELQSDKIKARVFKTINI